MLHHLSPAGEPHADRLGARGVTEPEVQRAAVLRHVGRLGADLLHAGAAVRGHPGDGPEPLGIGRTPAFHYNPKLFWDVKDSASSALLKPGPNNPVGVVWIDLSKPHYGIHGTPEPSRIGKTQSHGCIRLTNWSARAVAQAVAPGIAALLQE